VFERFLIEACGSSGSWTMDSIIDTAVAMIRQQVGDESAICGLSGGVDSAVAAALVHKAIGDQLTCVFVDTGLMRLNEGEQVVETFERNFGVQLVHAQAQDRFFAALTGITEPEAKRKAIGELFIRVFEGARAQAGEARFLVQGTLYPDVIESGESTLPRSRAITMSAGFQTTSSSLWWNRCGASSRTRFANWAANWAFPMKSLNANHFRGRVSASGSLARSLPAKSRPFSQRISSCARSCATPVSKG